MCFTRHFETRTRQAHLNKEIDCLVYLSLGQESIAAAVSTILGGSYVCAQHRGHAAYLSFGGNPVALVDELLGLPTGCCGGMGGSPPIHDIHKKIIGHCGLIGDQVGVSVGIALAKPEDRVVCFFGDGAAEEDYVLAALSYAASRQLQILFVCDDNDLSVLTPTKDRRTWLLEDVARAFGMRAVDIADDPWLIAHHARLLSKQLPALINVRTCRDVWHVGTGTDGAPEWNRFALTQEALEKTGLGVQAKEISDQERDRVEALWQERLQKRSKTLPAST